MRIGTAKKLGSVLRACGSLSIAGGLVAVGSFVGLAVASATGDHAVAQQAVQMAARHFDVIKLVGQHGGAGLAKDIAERVQSARIMDLGKAAFQSIKSDIVNQAMAVNTMIGGTLGMVGVASGLIAKEHGGKMVGKAEDREQRRKVYRAQQSQPSVW